MKRCLLTPTKEQVEQINLLLTNLRHAGGALMAQVFSDGIHVVHLDEEEAKLVAKATGASYLPKGNSGVKAFNEALLRDQKGGAK